MKQNVNVIGSFSKALYESDKVKVFWKVLPRPKTDRRKGRSGSVICINLLTVRICQLCVKFTILITHLIIDVSAVPCKKVLLNCVDRLIVRGIVKR